VHLRLINCNNLESYILVKNICSLYCRSGWHIWQLIVWTELKVELCIIAISGYVWPIFSNNRSQLNKYVSSIPIYKLYVTYFESATGSDTSIYKSEFIVFKHKFGKQHISEGSQDFFILFFQLWNSSYSLVPSTFHGEFIMQYIPHTYIPFFWRRKW
jgi:hypothetical protein